MELSNRVIVTEELSKVFGDLVLCAWMNEGNSGLDFNAYGLQYSDSIWVQFSNGSVVEFSTSEYALMTSSCEGL